MPEAFMSYHTSVNVHFLFQRFAKQSSAFAKLAKNEDKFDNQLDDELRQKENKPKNKCQKFRHKGKHALHSRIVLVVVVFLCVVDCILVIGELILDMHAIKEAAGGSHGDSHDSGVTHGNGTDVNHYEPALVDHHGEKGHEANPAYNSSRHRRSDSKAHGDGHDRVANGDHGNTGDHVEINHGEGSHGGGHAGNHGDGHHAHSIEQQVAHAFHFASITILGILMVETLFKIFFEGREFLNKKIEMFDAFVVIVSFIIDLAFLEGITTLPLQESAYILSFILPWRVIRVVNSLVVAVLDHEHFKLLLVYKSKKYLKKQMDEMQEDIHVIRKQLHAVKALCIEAGTEEWIVNQTIVRIAGQFQKKQKHALSSFASLTAGAVIDEKRSFRASKKRNVEKDININNEAKKLMHIHKGIASGGDDETPKSSRKSNGGGYNVVDEKKNGKFSQQKGDAPSSATRPLSFTPTDEDGLEFADDA
ncbi:uncharacterized protein LOC135467116 [Liolophura sinensis]|uniref:uncharacterized protein LOC135467116 n=1 Tax=Liolophura sinensis TaxID=3198878 RepID=UPI003157FC0B